MPDEIDPAALETLRIGSAVFAFLFGAAIGSFLNVVAHRLPLGLSIVKPRSRCPACRTPVASLDNLPVISWVLLGGRCRGCQGRISPRYAIVELLMGCMTVHVLWVLVLHPGAVLEVAAWLHFAAATAFVAALLAASLIDLDLRILPDKINKPGMVLAPVVALFVPRFVLGIGESLPGWLPDGISLRVGAALFSVAGIAAGAGVIWLLGKAGSAVFRKEAMGFGDVKFLGLIGGVVGPLGAVLTLVLASFLGAVLGLIRKLVTGDSYIPFGPFLAAGAYVVLLHRADIVDAWVAFATR